MKKSVLLVVLLGVSLASLGFVQGGNSSNITSMTTNVVDLPGDGNTVEISAGETKNLSISGPAGAISLNVTPSVNLELTITVELSNPNASLPDGLTGVGFYLVVDTNDTDADLSATLQFPFDPSIFPDEVDLSNLEFRFFDEFNDWESVVSVTDNEDNSVTAEISHFSTWTVTGEHKDYAQDGDHVDISLGTPVAVDPNSTVELVTPSGIAVILTTNESLEITFNEFDVNPNASLPEDLTSISTFVHVDLNESDTNFNATVNVPYDASQLRDSYEPEDIKLTYFDGSQWNDVDSLVNTSASIVSANTSHFSTWTAGYNGSIPTPEPGTPFEVENGKPVALIPGELLSLVTPFGISVNVTVNESIEITLTENTTNPVDGDVPTDRVSFDLFLTIELNESADVNATLSLPIPDDVPDNVNTSSLEFAFYNESSSAWETVPSWVEEGEVHANVTHFSSWTIFGEEITDDGSQDSESSEDPLSTATVPGDATASGLSLVGIGLMIVAVLAIPVVTRHSKINQ